MNDGTLGTHGKRKKKAKEPAGRRAVPAAI
jgi:hypothetical protein